MKPASSDTIFALASAPGKAGVAVMRVSGGKARSAVNALAALPNPVPRRLHRATLSDAQGTAIDAALVVFFDAPRSFTGEDVAEFHIHGGRAVAVKLSEALAELGLRMAEPGEFSRRAFLNGKLDLTEVEGLTDLINAETESQRVQALRQMGGALSDFYEALRARLLRLLAHVEADIDFPDEDLPPGLLNARAHDIDVLLAELYSHLNDARRGERLREGFSIAIMGAPNAGKSSLMNALAQREAAIVSARAGTTRDVVEAHLDIAGYPVILADTAGLRDTADAIEEEGVRRALARAEQADLKLVLFDATATPDEKSLALIDENTLVVLTKTDLSAAAPATVGPNSATLHSVIPAHAGIHGTHLSAVTPGDAMDASIRWHDGKPIFISTVTGSGIADLLNAITQKLKAWTETHAAPPLTRARHRQALQQAAEALQRAQQQVIANAPHELTAEELRAAAAALGRITGRVDVEDILDKIFRDFCIGK